MVLVDTMADTKKTCIFYTHHADAMNIRKAVTSEYNMTIPLYIHDDKLIGVVHNCQHLPTSTESNLGGGRGLRPASVLFLKC